MGTLMTEDNAMGTLMTESFAKLQADKSNLERNSMLNNSDNYATIMTLP